MGFYGIPILEVLQIRKSANVTRHQIDQNQGQCKFGCLSDEKLYKALAIKIEIKC